MRRPTYVVATDLSPQGDAALRAAAALAAKTHAHLELFCAVPAVVVDESQAIVERVRHGLERSARSLAQDGDPAGFETAVVRDVPKAIVARAAALDADLVAVGPTGVTGWKKFVLGSVTERLLRLCPQPLLVVRGRTAAAPSRILAAVDRSGGSRRVMRAAIDLARGCGATLTALHVLSPISAGLLLSPDLEAPARLLADDRVRTELRSFAAWTAGIPSQGVEVDCRVVEGNPAESIERTAADLGADLVVVGSQGKSAVHEFFVGSVARNVATHSATSVLVVRTHALSHGKRPGSARRASGASA